MKLVGNVEMAIYSPVSKLEIIPTLFEKSFKMFHIRACAGGNYRKILMRLKFGLLSFNPHVLPRFQFPATIFTGVMSDTRYLN